MMDPGVSTRTRNALVLSFWGTLGNNTSVFEREEGKRDRGEIGPKVTMVRQFSENLKGHHWGNELTYEIMKIRRKLFVTK